jgi:hypothetical protein
MGPIRALSRNWVVEWEEAVFSAVSWRYAATRNSIFDPVWIIVHTKEPEPPPEESEAKQKIRAWRAEERKKMVESMDKLLDKAQRMAQSGILGPRNGPSGPGSQASYSGTRSDTESNDLGGVGTGCEASSPGPVQRPARAGAVQAQLSADPAG